jgi:hypothetical protein
MSSTAPHAADASAGSSQPPPLAPHCVSRLYALPPFMKLVRRRHARGSDGPVNPNGVYFVPAAVMTACNHGEVRASCHTELLAGGSSALRRGGTRLRCANTGTATSTSAGSGYCPVALGYCLGPDAWAAAAQKRASGSGSRQSMTSWKRTAIKYSLAARSMAVCTRHPTFGATERRRGVTGPFSPNPRRDMAPGTSHTFGRSATATTSRQAVAG